MTCATVCHFLMWHFFYCELSTFFEGINYISSIKVVPSKQYNIL